MKKVIAMVLVLCLVLSMSVVSVSAQTFKQNQVIDEAISFRGISKNAWSRVNVTDNIHLLNSYYTKTEDDNTYI